MKFGDFLGHEIGECDFVSYQTIYGGEELPALVVDVICESDNAKVKTLFYLCSNGMIRSETIMNNEHYRMPKP